MNIVFHNCRQQFLIKALMKREEGTENLIVISVSMHITGGRGRFRRAVPSVQSTIAEVLCKGGEK